MEIKVEFLCSQIQYSITEITYSWTEPTHCSKSDLIHYRIIVVLVSWCFEANHPQRIMSGLKTNHDLSPSYSARKSSNHKFSNIYKISLKTNLCKRKHTYTNIKYNIFEELIPLVWPLLKKKKKKHMRLGFFSKLVGIFSRVNMRLGHAGLVDPAKITAAG